MENQSNSTMKVTNRTILQGLKKRLDDAKENWPKELRSVIWAYCTTLQTTIEATLFSLTYGSETIIPVEFQVLNTKALDSNLANQDEDIYFSIE